MGSVCGKSRAGAARMSDGAEERSIGWEAISYDGGEDAPEPDRAPDPGVWPPPPTSGPLWLGAAPTYWWDWIPLVLMVLPFLAVFLVAALAASPIAWVRRKARGPLRRQRRRAKERRAGVA